MQTLQHLVLSGLAALCVSVSPAAAQSAQPSSGAAYIKEAAAAPAAVGRIQPSYRIESQLRSKAIRWEIGYLALSAIDAAQTIECLNRGICQEANPLFGKRPSTSKILLAKAGFGLAHFGLFKHALNRDPKAALRIAQVSAAMQGGVVMLNARFSFR